jgi:hypothetical protein
MVAASNLDEVIAFFSTVNLMFLPRYGPGIDSASLTAICVPIVLKI